MKNKLKKVLDEKKITRYRMAKDLGLSLPTVYTWCKNDNLTPGKMKIICEYLKEPIGYVFEL